MKVSKKNLLMTIACIPLLFICTLASLSKFVPVAILFVFAIILIGQDFCILYSRKVPANFATFWVLAMLLVYFNNNAYFIPNSMSYMRYFLLFPACLIFAARGGYLDTRWMNILLSMLKIAYMVYVIFTIGMFLSSGVTQFVCGLFPEDAETIVKQCSKAGIPGLTVHYSTNGMLLSVGTLIYGSYALVQKKTSQKILFIVSIVALLLCGKRAHAIFGILALYLTYYVYNADNKVNRMTKVIGVLLGGVSLFVIASTFVPALGNVVTRFINAADAGDVSVGRFDVWTTAIDSITGHTFLGIGWGQYVNQGGWLYNIHNIYLQLLIETGVIGSILFIGWFVFHLIRTWKTYSYMRVSSDCYSKIDTTAMNFSLGMQILFVLYGFTGNPLYDKEMFVPYLIACAISVYFTNNKF